MMSNPDPDIAVWIAAASLVASLSSAWVAYLAISLSRAILASHLELKAKIKRQQEAQDDSNAYIYSWMERIMKLREDGDVRH